MMKKVIALLLCVLMLVPVLASCNQKVDENDKGAYIYMYLSDQVYDLDPAYAYNNESALRVVSLLFDNLFVLDENGKVKKSLAKDYTIREDDKNGEYEMIITLNETSWSDGSAITANDVYFAWTRILSPANNFEAASLLFDIKNARAAKEGDSEISIDDVAISAINESQIQIFFEEKIDYDQFLLNLTSYALVPLRSEIVEKNSDWAKKPATICTSGPFRLREVSYVPGEEKMVLERNMYYYRDIEEDELDKSVTPYRLIVDYTMTDEQIMQAYNDGKLFFVGDVPLSIRGSFGADVKPEDALSTHTYVLNQNALIKRTDGAPAEKLFANADVRNALSAAIDREAIAEAVVYAKAATALVPCGVFNAGNKGGLFSKAKTFRDVGGDIIATSKNEQKAQDLLTKAGVTASKYEFSISVPAYDEVHVAIAEMVAASWSALGFKVSVNKVETIANDEEDKSTQEVDRNIRDDVFAENFRAGKFEVAAVDYVAHSADAFSVLAPYAKSFTGLASSAEKRTEFIIPTHVSGYDKAEYNALIESAFAEKDIKARAEILHEAEKMLMEDMPVIPIVFNQTKTLISKDLSKVVTTYYGTFNFNKAKLKDYQQYVPTEE
ncbi:MAG: peptide ABC transporter substrate-binding protein [Ruminococcaceae bacterium]|nr:peptide ABC transporter substrate-binding protein [Oscillospiraceae bacterium]